MYKKIFSTVSLLGFGLAALTVTAHEHHHHEGYSAQFAAASPAEGS